MSKRFQGAIFGAPYTPTYQRRVVEARVDLGVVERVLHRRSPPSSRVQRRRRAVLDQRHGLGHPVRRRRRHHQSGRPAVRQRRTLRHARCSAAASCVHTHRITPPAYARSHAISDVDLTVYKSSFYPRHPPVSLQRFDTVGSMTGRTTVSKKSRARNPKRLFFEQKIYGGPGLTWSRPNLRKIGRLNKN